MNEGEQEEDLRPAWMRLMEDFAHREGGMVRAAELSTMFASGLFAALLHPEWTQAYMAELDESGIGDAARLQAGFTVKSMPIRRLSRE